VRDHDIEGVIRTSAERRRVGQWIDDLELLDDRARPSVGDDQWKGIRMLRPDMDEVNVETVDLGHELRIAVELRFDFPPIVPIRPIVGELLNRRQLNALRVVVYGLTLRPSVGQNSLA